jgi:hypothetical protein
MMAERSIDGVILVGKVGMNSLRLWMVFVGKASPVLFISKFGHIRIPLKIKLVGIICFLRGVLKPLQVLLPDRVGRSKVPTEA